MAIWNNLKRYTEIFRSNGQIEMDSETVFITLYKNETLPVRYGAPNAKLCRFSLWKCGIFMPYSHRKSLVRIMLCVPQRTWLEMLLDFRLENKAKCCQIFVVEIW